MLGCSSNKSGSQCPFTATESGCQGISLVQHAFLTHSVSTLLSLRPIPSDEKDNATRPLQYYSLCACVFFTKAPTKPHFKVNLETIRFTSKSMCHDDMSMNYILYIYIQYIFYNIQSSINSPVIYNIFLRIFPQNTKLQFSSTARQPPCLSFHFKGHHRIRVRQLHLALAPGFAFLLYIFARQKLCSQLITEPYREIPSQW